MRSAMDRSLPVLLLGLLALTLAACGGGGPVCVDEYIVNKTADTNDGSCTADDCSLREAVRNANACAGWQTITIPAADYPLTIAGRDEDAAATGDLDITDNVTIVGEGVPSIDGQGLDRIFEVFSPAVVRIETLIVLNGQAQIGAGIHNHSQLTLDGLSIQGNHAVVPPGGAGTSAGGGIFNEAGTLTLVNTQIFENSADHGAGIHNFATAHLEATDLLLGLNAAAVDAGGLWNNMAAEAVLNDVTLVRNSAPGNGAGIYNDGHLEINLATFEENTGAEQGGGLYNVDGAEAFLYDAWFTNNSAVDGGAVWNEGLLHLYRSSLTVNSAMGGLGGGVYNASPGALLLRNVTISGNMADPAVRTGAGVYNNGGEMRVEFVTLAYNSPDGILNEGGGTIDMRSTILGHHALGNCLSVGSAGYNLADDATCGLTEASDLPDTDALLAWLAMNGGTNLSHALNPGSPAIDSGTPDLCTSEDQRGISRPQGAGCDRGALEMEAAPRPPTLVPTPTEVATPTPVGVSGTLNKNAFCRRGPATAYFDDDAYPLGQSLKLEAVSAPGQPVWYWALTPDGTAHCWISAAVLDVQGPAETLPVGSAPPIPPAPTGLEIGRRMCEVTKKAYIVRVEWNDLSGETGYHIYRNGALLATLPAGSTSYTDNPPLGGPYTYAMEAYNKDAVSPQVTLVEEGCK
jgi:CSLREA domain-containing protein